MIHEVKVRYAQIWCPILSNTYEHVPIYHSIVFDSTPSSNFIKHVWTCPDLSFDRLGLYTFLHSLRSNFSPSRPLQLWFEAAYETSLARDIHAMQSTPKSRRGRYCFFVRLSVCSVVVDDKRERQNIARAYGTGVGARRGHWFNIAIMLLLVLRHPTCASCVAWMCCRMSNSIKHVWARPDQSSRRGHRFFYCNHVVVSDTSSNLCIMRCMNVL